MIFISLYLLRVMKFCSSARNSIYNRRKSPLIENKSAAAAKLISWLQRIISQSQHINLFFFCVFTYQRRISYIEEEHTKKEIHLIERIFLLQQIKKIICCRRLFLCHYMLCSRGFVFWVKAE
jgi:hypothetical protein